MFEFSGTAPCAMRRRLLNIKEQTVANPTLMTSGLPGKTIYSDRESLILAIVGAENRSNMHTATGFVKVIIRRGCH